MDASVWVSAVCGLAGTGIGGGLSIWSSVMAQRQLAKNTREEERRARAAAAVEAAMAELLEIQRDTRRIAAPTAREERLQRSRNLHDRILKIQLLTQRIPDPDVRLRVKEAAFFMPLSPPDDTRTPQERRIDILELCGDAIACLGAHLREEPLPPRAESVERLRTAWPDFQHQPDSNFYYWETQS